MMNGKDRSSGGTDEAVSDERVPHTWLWPLCDSPLDGMKILSNDLILDLVISFSVGPIEPKSSAFEYTSEYGEKFNVSRKQVPLLPAFCITDYKSQGQSMTFAIIDLASARTLNSVYVMLSRVKSLSGLAILRPFPENKISQRMSQELRDEFLRLRTLININKTDTYLQPS